MVDYHLMSEQEELSSRNGAAILTVARELAAAALRAGHRAVIAGAEGRVIDEPLAVAVFRSHSGPRNIKSAISRVSCALLGRPFFDPYMEVNLNLNVGDTLYVHNGPWLGWHLRRRANGARLVLYVHNTLMNGAPAAAIRKALAPFDYIICVSDYVRRELASRAKLDPDNRRFATVRNAAPGTWAVPRDAGVRDIDVLYVGRMSVEKGVETLVDAVALSGRQLSVTMVGGTGFLPREEVPRFEQAMHERADASGAQFEWTGPVPPLEVAKYRSRAKVTVVPSLWQDPCPLALLEAMASTSATVATRSGGMVEFGRSGGIEFVAPGDHTDLCLAITTLIDDDAAQRANALAGAREMREYTWDDAYRLSADAVGAP